MNRKYQSVESRSESQYFCAFLGAGMVKWPEHFPSKSPHQAFDWACIFHAGARFKWNVCCLTGNKPVVIGVYGQSNKAYLTFRTIATAKALQEKHVFRYDKG